MISELFTTRLFEKLLALVFLLLTIPSYANEILINLTTDITKPTYLYIEVVAAADETWDKPIQQSKFKLLTGQEQITLTNLAAGSYALRAFLDLDNNQQLNLTKRGLPLEPFGFIDCKKGHKKQPKPHDCAFLVTANTKEFDLKLIQLKP